MMHVQMDLFPPYRKPRARKADPETSKIAADQAGELSRDHYIKIIDAVSRRPGTIYDIAERAGLSHVQVARRMPELQSMGWVEPTESVPGPTGRPCRVWRAK